jgi:beta-N-acetylhexosaminidase
MAAAIQSKAYAETALRPGQLLITGFRGTTPGDAEVNSVCKMLEEGLCAGVILLRRNCISPEQISLLSRTFRDAAGTLTPIISIDQEGGRVARLDANNGFFDWMSARAITDSHMSEAEIETYWTKRAWQLSEVGINLNFAPVVDLNLNPDNPIIGKLGRAYSSKPDKVSHMAEIFVRSHRAAGVRTSLKHFPGHGSSNTDSHKDAVDISQSWKKIEVEPFRNMVRAGLTDSVMIGHLLHPGFSDEPWMPASLSWRSVNAIREMLGFQGVIITDDMQMAAVEDLLPLGAAAVAAVNAGNTFLIYSNYRKSDPIDTVERVAVALVDSMDQMSPASVAGQIMLANGFRSLLR